MRTLVEQTEEVARSMAERMSADKRPGVHVAMGGVDSGEWILDPERPAIIVGTQDMLLSRALNRGYASGRARWPVEFGLLHHDALWVMDEVQLMDVGLATSAQLQAFRDADQAKSLRPCFTWWMSATIQPNWLRTIDTEDFHAEWTNAPCTATLAQRNDGPWKIKKPLATHSIEVHKVRDFAKQILAEHGNAPATDHGRITLVVCNTVERACQTFDALKAEGRDSDLHLVHSRFRPAEREAWRKQILSRSACTPETDRIIVATQVVEAGVDISAVCLITELAPWSSLVQRFGRCARYGGTGRVVVVNRGFGDQKLTAPYQPEELERAWEAVQQLNDVGIATLEAHEESLSPDARAHLYPYAPTQLLLRKEFDELFDTSPDLTGADLDISRFIRSGDERDLQVFWINIEKDRKGQELKSPRDEYKPQRRELCAVPFLHARQWLCEKGKSRLKPSKRAWIWDWLDGEWKPANAESLLPGRVVCVAADTGGYTVERGFSADSTTPVPVVDREQVDPVVRAVEAADDQPDSEQLNGLRHWKTIAFHSAEVAQAAKDIAQQLCLSQELQTIVELAALWHDWGKSHPAFQGSIRGSDKTQRLSRLDCAKAPPECWPKKHRYQYLDNTDARPGFRHELASALGLFAILEAYASEHDALLGPWREVLGTVGDAPQINNPKPTPPSSLVRRLLECSSEELNLVAYLVASHHGKVRVNLHASPKDQEYRDTDQRGLPICGIRDGDCLPETILVPNDSPVPAVVLGLSLAQLGLSPRTGISWRERCMELINRHTPAALAFLEAILRAADVRASRLTTNDPILEADANA